MSAQIGRKTRNSSLFRAINDHIAEMSRGIPASREFEVLCECDSLDCTQTIALRVDQYEELRNREGAFIVLPGHEGSGSDRIVSETDRYLVLEKDATPAG
jgi:hypothetical protein